MTRFVPAAIAREMREGYWLAPSRPLGPRTNVVVGGPRVLSESDRKGVVEAVRTAHKIVEDRCVNPSENRLENITVFLSDRRKTLPERPGAEIGSEHMNSGVTTFSGGSARVLVYRREDLLKTLIHEMLHVRGVGDWMHDDPIVIRHSNRLASEGGIRTRDNRDADAKGVIACEALVDLWAMHLHEEATGCSREDSELLTWDLCYSLAAHFGMGGRWRESTNGFAYSFLRLVLMGRGDEILSSPPDDPPRTVIRDALAVRSAPFETVFSASPGPASVSLASTERLMPQRARRAV